MNDIIRTSNLYSNPRDVVASGGMTETRGGASMFNILSQKCCNKCKEYKDRAEFAKDKYAKDGLQGTCRSCRVSQRRKSYEKNTAKEKARAAAWLKQNPEKKHKQQNAWYLANKERIIGRITKWVSENPTKFKAIQHKRRAKVLASTSNHITHQQWDFLLRISNNSCMACGSTKKLQLDHIVAISRGGKNEFTNAQVLCQSCNCRKHDKTIDYRSEAVKEAVKNFLESGGVRLFK